MSDSREAQYMSFHLQPQISNKLLRGTFEGNVLWGVFQAKVDPSTVNDITLSRELVRGWGNSIFGTPFGSLKNWIELAESSSGEFAAQVLPLLREALLEGGADNVLQLELSHPGSGQPFTVTSLLQGLLRQHGDDCKAEHFNLHISQGLEYGSPMSVVSVVTADEIDTLDTDAWLDEKHEARLTNSAAYSRP